MASSKQVLLLAAVAAVACLTSCASATVWMVGDDGGWRAKFNETGWANGKTFVVGDSLMFMYAPGSHTVAKVGQEAFATCDLNATLQLWSSGNDIVTLDKPGKVWFICTVPGHCANGMKLVVDVVVGATTAAPAPAPFFWFPFPLPGVPAPAPAPASWFRVPPWGTRAAAPAPASPPAWPPASPASSPEWPPASPPSAAVRYPVGSAVAAAVAAVVAAALAF